MITYSRKKDEYCEKNWYFEFEKSDSELQKSLEKTNYCYHKQSNKTVYVVEENETRKGLYIAEKKDSYSIKYMDEHGNVEKILSECDEIIEHTYRIYIKESISL